MHEEHQFWDPDSVVPEWDDNVSLAELGYGLFMLALALFVLYIYATINALYSADPNVCLLVYESEFLVLLCSLAFPSPQMLESSLTPFGRHWVERGYSSEYLPPIPAGRNERLEQHNIYTLPKCVSRFIVVLQWLLCVGCNSQNVCCSALDAIENRPGVKKYEN